MESNSEKEDYRGYTTDFMFGGYYGKEAIDKWIELNKRCGLPNADFNTSPSDADFEEGDQMMYDNLFEYMYCIIHKYNSKDSTCIVSVPLLDYDFVGGIIIEFWEVKSYDLYTYSEFYKKTRYYTKVIYPGVASDIGIEEVETSIINEKIPIKVYKPKSSEDK